MFPFESETIRLVIRSAAAFAEAGKALPINVDGAIGAVLGDLGFEIAALRLGIHPLLLRQPASGVHLALLGSGDRVHAPTGAIERAPSSTPLVPGGGPTPELVIEELWGPTALRSACSHLATSTGSSALLTDVHVQALLRHEERTSAWLTEEDGTFERPSISGLRLDLYRVTY